MLAASSFCAPRASVVFGAVVGVVVGKKFLVGVSAFLLVTFCVRSDEDIFVMSQDAPMVKKDTATRRGTCTLRNFLPRGRRWEGRSDGRDAHGQLAYDVSLPLGTTDEGQNIKAHYDTAS